MSGKKSVGIASLFLMFVLLACFLTIPCLGAQAPTASFVDAACVFNIEYNTVVYAKQIEQIVYPASTVKLMTALTAYRLLDENLSRVITVTKEMKKAFDGRMFGFMEGEQISLADVMAAMLVGGYNDAAILLAFAASGNIDSFCAQMNAYAWELGAENTRYTNPTGLHDDTMVTTAYDTALIAAQFMKTDFLFQISQNANYVLPKTNLRNAKTIYTTNALLSTITTAEYRLPQALGMNAGSTDEGGDCVVTGGKKGDLSYVTVVLGGRKATEEDTQNHAFAAAKELLSYALDHFSLVQLNTGKEIYTSLPVELSATITHINIKATDILYAVLPSDVDEKTQISTVATYTADVLQAPFSEGTVVGTLHVYYGGKLIGQTNLVTSGGAEAHVFLVAMAKIKTIMKKPLFWLIIALPIPLFVLLFKTRNRLFVYLFSKKRKYK